MNVGIGRKRSRTAPGSVPDRAALAKLIGKGDAGPLGPGATPADPKDVGREAQSIRLARLLVRHR